MIERDLLGDPLTDAPPAPRQGPKGGKRYTIPRGYIARPGTGPKGETCGTCRHIVRNRKYRKCGLNRPRWTSGPGTDILARSPACSRWESAK